MSNVLSPYTYSIPFKALAVSPVKFPVIGKDDSTKSITIATKRKNRTRGVPPDAVTCTFRISASDRNVFKKVCRANGKGMSEVVNAFMVAYNTKGKDAIINKILG